MSAPTQPACPVIRDGSVVPMIAPNSSSSPGVAAAGLQHPAVVGQLHAVNKPVRRCTGPPLYRTPTVGLRER